MALAEAIKTEEPTYTINDSMNVLLGKFDEAIDDMENGRVQTIDEAWEEIDNAQVDLAIAQSEDEMAKGGELLDAKEVLISLRRKYFG